MHGGVPREDDYDSVTELMPKYHLIVSHGKVETIGNILTYGYTTIKGQLMTVLGVHLGHCGIPRNTANKALSFECDRVWKPLIKLEVINGKSCEAICDES